MPKIDLNIPTLKKLRTLAIVMLIASIIVCLYGCYIILSCIHEFSELSAEGEMAREAVAPVVAELAEGVVLAVHYFFVSKFFLHSIQHGVPFTHEGAREVKILGLETIFLPILAWIVSAVAYSGIKPASMVFAMSVYEIVLGFALIIASYMMEYATDKIEAGHRGHQAIRYLMEHYPKIANEARDAVIAQGYVFPDHDVEKAKM